HGAGHVDRLHGVHGRADPGAGLWRARAAVRQLAADLLDDRRAGGARPDLVRGAHARDTGARGPIAHFAQPDLERVARNRDGPAVAGLYAGGDRADGGALWLSELDPADHGGDLWSREAARADLRDDLDDDGGGQSAQLAH